MYNDSVQSTSLCSGSPQGLELVIYMYRVISPEGMHPYPSSKGNTAIILIFLLETWEFFIKNILQNSFLAS